MNYTITAGKHSADKDHTTMTGGTLSVDKTVKCGEGVTFYTYSIPFYTGGKFDEDFHKGVHTAEHMIAYKKDTGSVRNSLEEVTQGALSGKVILDISPYKTSENSFGFRITSMVALKKEYIERLLKLSIERAIVFLENGILENPDDFKGIPFARAISCGQFDFHDKERAIHDLKKVQVDNLDIKEIVISGKQQTAYVCDLRFLKPKIQGGNNMTMFSPDLSYRLSMLIETELPKKLPGSIVLVGTFGCMTGMYLCISSVLGDESDLKTIHRAIIELLEEKIELDTLSESENLQFTTLLENYSRFGNTE